MTKNTTIVTCLYNCSPYSRIGGRGYSWDHYLAPFTNLLFLNSNIVVFTEKHTGEQLQEYFKIHDFTNYKIIIHDLNTYRHSNSIYNLKEKQGIIDKKGLIEGVPYIRNDRNHHICLSKTQFLDRTIKEGLFDTEYFYWVDGGLFHHGLIPYSLGGMELHTKPDETRLWPQNKSSISNPDFFPKLLKKTSKDLTFLGLDGWYHRPAELTNFFDKEKVTHIVGGLFGGRKKTVVEFCEKVNKVVDCLFDEDVLSLEEEVLSGVFVDNFSDQGYLPFNYWSHDEPDEPNHLGAPPGSDSFYKLFL
jgi:hypothetical protein